METFINAAIGGSIGAIVGGCISLYIFRQERNKEKETERKEIVEKIAEKLIILDNHQQHLARWMQKAKQSQEEGKFFVYDERLWSDKEKFDKNCDLIAVWIYLYFSKDLQEKWNLCQDGMNRCFHRFVIAEAIIKDGKSPNWGDLIKEFNEGAEQIGSIPKEIVDILKKDLKIKL